MSSVCGFVLKLSGGSKATTPSACRLEIIDKRLSPGNAFLGIIFLLISPHLQPLRQLIGSWILSICYRVITLELNFNASILVGDAFLSPA
jgi:hypothetical protein